MVGTGTSGGDAEAWAFQVEFHRQMTCGCIVHQLWHHKGMHPVLALFINSAVIVIPSVDAATRRAKHNASVIAQPAIKIQTRLRNGLTGRQQSKLGELVIKNNLLTVEIRFGIPVVNLPADLDRQSVAVTDIKV